MSSRLHVKLFAHYHFRWAAFVSVVLFGLGLWGEADLQQIASPSSSACGIPTGKKQETGSPGRCCCIMARCQIQDSEPLPPSTSKHSFQSLKFDQLEVMAKRLRLKLKWLQKKSRRHITMSSRWTQYNLLNALKAEAFVELLLTKRSRRNHFFSNNFLDLAEAAEHCIVSHSPGMSSCVIGISGASGSGKTTLAEHLATRLRDEGVRVEIVHQDWHWQRSSLNKTAEGKRTWEGPQFTDWAWLEWSVMEAKQRASVVIVEGYLLLDCTTALFDSLDLLFLVESTKEQCLSRRTSFPSDWPSSMAYAEACVWPVHKGYMQRAAQRMASPPERLCNMKAAPVLRLPVDQDTSTRAAFAWNTIPSNVIRLESRRSQDERSPVQFASWISCGGGLVRKTSEIHRNPQLKDFSKVTS